MIFDHEHSCLSAKIDQLVGAEIGLTFDEVNNRKQKELLECGGGILSNKMMVCRSRLILFNYLQNAPRKSKIKRFH